MDKNEKDRWLPEMFRLFYENMAAFLGEYDAEREAWLREVSPALDKAPRQVILCLAEGKLAGYLQYYVRGSMLMVEELQIGKQYQSTSVFYSLCKFLAAGLPEEVETLEAYAHPGNERSLGIMTRLGMKAVEGEELPFVHLRGKLPGNRI